MPSLVFRFSGRRYHATPWGHHVNEGLIEWPPSPWRLLRALLSVGYTAGVWDGSDPPGHARTLIEKLASSLPRYTLPPAAGAHSRHYMPLARLKNGREDTTLVFDTWAQVDQGELTVTWDVELSEAEAELLAKLAERLGYLGRSESWVTARLARSGEPIPASNCFHEGVQSNPGPGWEQVPLLAAEGQRIFAEWRDHALAQALTHFPLLEGKKPTRKLLSDRARAEEPYPADLIACLQVETNWLRKHGWSQPPGSRRVFYWRKVDALEVGAPKPKPQPVLVPPVKFMLLAMSAAGGNDHALPLVRRTLPQAELLHRALVTFSARTGEHSRALTGCDDEGRPLRGPHGHAHVLPLDLDRDGHIDHILSLY